MIPRVFDYARKCVHAEICRNELELGCFYECVRKRIKRLLFLKLAESRG